MREQRQCYDRRTCCSRSIRHKLSANLPNHLFLGGSRVAVCKCDSNRSLVAHIKLVSRVTSGANDNVVLILGDSLFMARRTCAQRVFLFEPASSITNIIVVPPQRKTNLTLYPTLNQKNPFRCLPVILHSVYETLLLARRGGLSGSTMSTIINTWHGDESLLKNHKEIGMG